MAVPTVGQIVFVIMPRDSSTAPVLWSPAIVEAVGAAIPPGSMGVGYMVDVSIGYGSTATVRLYADRATAATYAQPGGQLPFLASAV